MSFGGSALGLGIEISLRDRASQALEQIKNKLAGFKVEAQATVKEAENLNTSMQTMGTGFKEMASDFQMSMMALNSSISVIKQGFGMFSTVSRIFGPSVGIAREYEYEMQRIQAVTRGTAEEMKALREQNERLGRTTQFTDTQIAKAQEDLSRLGLSNSQVIATIPNAVNMAIAEGMSVQEAAGIILETMDRFNKTFEETGNVTDLFTHAARATSLSVRKLADAMVRAGPVAKNMGQSLEEATSWIATLDKAGYKGSEGGNAFKGIFTRLISSKNLKLMEQMGIATHDANGQLVSFQELLSGLYQATKEMNVEQRTEIFDKMFGKYYLGAAQAIAEKAADAGEFGFNAIYNRVKQYQGATKEMAGTMADTAEGAVYRLESAIFSLRKAIGGALLEAFHSINDTLAKFIGKITEFMQAHPQLAQNIVRITALVIGVGSAVAGVILILAGLYATFKILKPMALKALLAIKTGAAVALKSLVLMIPKMLFIAGLASLIYYAWKTNFLGIRDMLTAVIEGFKMAFKAGKDGIVEVDEELAQRLEKAGVWNFAVMMGKVFYRIRKFFEGFVEGVKAGINVIREAFETLGKIAKPFRPLLESLGLFTDVANSNTDAWEAWGKVIGKIITLILAFLVVGQALKALIGIFMAIGGAINFLWQVASVVFGLLWKTIAGLWALALAHPFVAIVVGIIALIALLYYHWDYFKNWFQELWASLVQYFSSVWDVIAGVFEFFIGLFTLNWDKMVSGLGRIFQGLIGIVRNAIKFILTLLDPLFSALKWVGEKLGLIEETAAEVNTTAAAAAGIEKTQEEAQKAEASAASPAAAAIAEKAEQEVQEVKPASFSQIGQIPEVQERIQAPVKTQPASPVLAKQAENMAFGQAQAMSGAINKNSLNVKNDTKVDVKVMPMTTQINLDGDRLGEAVTNFQVRQNIRQGESEIE